MRLRQLTMQQLSLCLLCSKVISYWQGLEWQENQLNQELLKLSSWQNSGHFQFDIEDLLIP